jgi:hypothetical protein
MRYEYLDKIWAASSFQLRYCFFIVFFSIIHWSPDETIENWVFNFDLKFGVQIVFNDSNLLQKSQMVCLFLAETRTSPPANVYEQCKNSIAFSYLSMRQAKRSETFATNYFYWRILLYKRTSEVLGSFRPNRKSKVAWPETFSNRRCRS